LLAGAHLGNRALSLEEHVELYGSLGATGDNVIAEVQASGLRGRGGAGFPTGTKLAAVAARSGRPVIVVNATEGEPASGKDKALLRLAPHLVLDGAAAAATALGAREVVIAIGRGARAEHDQVVRALSARSDRLRWRLARVPDGFVAGEETAVVNALEGRAPKPALKPPFPAERGLRGAPTLVQNVETLAHLALIARFGAGWFRSLGTDEEPGTALVTVSGAVARPGIHEVELGTTVSALVAQAGGATEPLGAALVGGTRDFDHVLSAKDGLGAGVVVAWPRGACAVGEGARVARYLADESAGQCGPCLHGLAALATGLAEVASGQKGDRRAQLARWAGQVTARGACHHPDGAARFVTSMLDIFADELSLHLRKGRCGGSDRRLLQVEGR
jgi:NADH:ubiquinone oxidoreductase subunit F (NADH-binding)